MSDYITAAEAPTAHDRRTLASLAGEDRAALLRELDAGEAALTAMDKRAAEAEAERDGLRAIVEGRTVAPTDAEIAAHEKARGRWSVVGEGANAGFATLTRYAEKAREIRGMAADLDGITRWWPLDASGRPCPWPTVAAEAATGAALADVSETVPS
jgi:hypothetical protein